MPEKPAIMPPAIEAIVSARRRLTPRSAAAAGFSPAAYIRNPMRVRLSRTCKAAVRAARMTNTNGTGPSSPWPMKKNTGWS